MRRMLFFCGAIIILLLCLRWCFFTHCRAYNFLFIADPFLSSVCCSSLESEFLHCFEKKNSGLDVAVYVKKKFPIIRSVSVSYQPTVALVNIAVYKPIYMINDSLVLTENNDLVEKTLFAESVLGDLPCVTASQNFLASNAGSLSNLLQKLPVQWAESYDCDCVSEYCIRLTDKFNSRFVIVYSEDQIVSAHMLDQCESVKKDIIKHGMLDKNVSWVADIRFANYIVAYKA